MKLSDFDFPLPDHLIATRPAVPRSASRLLVADGREIVENSVVWYKSRAFLAISAIKSIIHTRVNNARLGAPEKGLAG